MVMLDLRKAAKQEAVDLGPLPPLQPEEHLLAADTWRGRMVNEHVSAQVFAGLLPQAMRAGISAEVQQSLATMIGEELQHARSCAAVLAALGEDAVGELPEVRPLPEHEDCDRLVAFLRNLLSVSCLSETVAVALIEGERRDLDTAPAGRVLRDILGDEVGHARLGWQILGEATPGLTLAQRAALDAYLPVALRHLLEFELAHLSPAPQPSAAAAEVGVCDGQNARRILFETVEQVIVPGLERVGLAGRQAWQATLQARGSFRSSSASARNSASLA